MDLQLEVANTHSKIFMCDVKLNSINIQDTLVFNDNVTVFYQLENDLECFNYTMNAQLFCGQLINSNINNGW